MKDTTFDKLPNLSKLAICFGDVIINCSPDVEILRKAILRYHESHVFKSIDMTDEILKIIMRRKNSNDDYTYTLDVNGEKKFLNVWDKEYSFTDEKHSGVPFNNLFHIFKGFVSPKDRLFIHPKGNYYVVENEDKIERYIYLPEGDYPCCIPEFNEHVEKYKADLMMNNFHKWYTWSNASKIDEFEKHFGKEFILYDTRSKKSFIKKSVHFSDKIVCLIPRDDTINLKKYVAFLNETKPKNINNIKSLKM
jgi:hypothetical protein